MWTAYLEARDWNVCALCSDFNLGEQKNPSAPNLALFLKVPNSNAPGAFYQDKLFFGCAHFEVNILAAKTFWR